MDRNLEIRKPNAEDHVHAMAVEPLERRALLAGNVSAVVSGSTLLLRGDDAANDILLTQIGQTLHIQSGANTTAIDTTQAENIDRLLWTGRGGADRIELRGADLPRGLRVAGDAAQTLVMDDTRVGGDPRVYGLDLDREYP